MRPQRPRLLLALLLAAVFARLLPAQSPIDPGQLPSHTSFYLLWHGTPTGEARTNSAVFALWDDPEFVSARSSFLSAALNDSKADSQPSVPPQEIAPFAALLDNPFIIGFLHQSESAPAAKTTGAKSAPAWNGVFFIYDRTGKEELLS